MSQKTLYYAQLAEDTARRLTGSWESWSGFLTTAGRLYKYPYPDQLMIYAQRPDATACASYDVWNDRMNRYVRRGSKGIALLDDAGDQLRLRYVFDLADTGTRPNSRDPWLWTLEDRHGIPVKAMLERRYGTAADTLPQQFADAAGQLADAYWADHGQEIGGILANSLLEEYDELNRGLAFKRAVTASTTFALLSRCGYAPENHFGAETFRNIYEFNTPATVAALGTAVSESSREVLLQIAAVVRQVERDIAEERRLWDEQHEYRVQAQRGLSGPEHRTEPAADALGQVRADAPDISQGEPSRPVQSPAPERDAVPAPGGDRPDSEGPLGPADGGAAETEPGPGQSGAADGLGAAHERSENAGRGSDPERADLQLSFFTTEAEQIAQIDQRAETEQVSAFSFSEVDWREALASGSGFENGKARIAAYYAENHTQKERIEFLKKEYGTGGCSWTFQDGSNGFLDYDASGVKLRSYHNGQEQRLKWPEVEKRIHVLIATGQYRDKAEQTVPTEGEILREKLAERGIVNGQVIDPEKLDSDPFIRQVVADVTAREMEPVTEAAEPVPLELAQTEPPEPEALPDESAAPNEPTATSAPEAFYPADKNDLSYDVEVERLRVDQPQPEIPAPPAQNFRITDEHLGEGGPKQKFARNIEAIRTLQAIEAEGRSATPEEQTVLSRYVGWGGLADAFDPDKDSWAKEYTQLKELLSPEEYAAARASTLNAHYTSPTVIRAIYDAVEQMGFQTGNILEPSCGVGNFFGMLPESMQGSRLYGVELDSITGRIARQLYPEANITVAGFETTSQRDFYDLAVGNVPFGNYKVNDKAYNNLGFTIHNYFFAKALDQVRPGGVVAFVTSRFTMDSKDSSARKYLAQRADLLGAVRLPNNAFKANAGTEVVSDILFLQKLERPIDREPEWVQVGQTPEGFTVNQYFVDHPDMVLGELSAESTQYGREDVTVDPIEGADLAEQLKSAMAHINGRYEAVERVNTELDEGAPDVLPADPSVKNFSYTVVDGEVYYRENSVMNPTELSDDAKERVKGMVGLRSLVNELISYQLEDFPDADIAAKQAELNAAYDAFIAKYGLLNDRKNGRLFEDDSSYYLLCSLENLDENGKLKSKADMFTKRTIRPERTITHVDTPAEALAVSIGEKGKVDLSYMAELLGTPGDFERITGELRGAIFKDPSEDVSDPEAGWQTADEYLSGNVRNKLQIARLAAANDPTFAVNVEALTKAQPKELEASEIDVRLGTTWISPDIIQKFMNETFQIPFYLRYAIRVKFSPATAEWRIEGKTKTGHNDVMAYETFGTVRASAYKILEDTLNLRDVRVYDTVEDDSGKPKRVLNKKETMLAGQKQQAIKDAFANWVWQDPQRRESLVKQYNELFNSTRPREYDGSHIHFVGMNPEITLREHQRNAIAHVLYGGNTLLAHEVGAGKTFEMAASAMEAKRLGLCQKSLFVVPNHLTLQWAQEFLHLYPSAKLLVASKKDFETANRKKFCARIATGDYDAVIIGHSQFEKIPLSFERQERIIQEQIDEIQSGIAELKHSSGEKFTIKQMEKSRKQLEMKLEKLRATERKDDVVTFEELGVDRLFVDESHSFKNLFLVTKMRNVAGLSTSEAQKSSDMFGKCRYMDELTGGRGVVFATGTPVSNSMVELFTVMRYLQYGTLQQKGLTHFDCWASTFGETTTSIELAPEGTGYGARTRFAKFFNLPELMTMFKEVADIKTSDQLHLPVPEAKFETVLVKPSEIQKEMVQSLSERAGKINAGMVDASEDNMLCVTNDGRKIGLDQRLMNSLLPDDPNSKLNACVRNVLRIWEEGKADRLTQLLFCDLSTPKGDGQFNVYDDVKKKLLAAGVPESEVAFIHTADTEAKKKELFSKVRTGQVRILLGSTAKMGAGTNVQDRLVAVHHLDVGWKPSDMTQRNGRIIRQGNRNKTVQIYNYVTEGTFDAYLWQTLENKQRFIGQIMTSKSPVRSCEDVDEQVLSYAEVKALCAGNPLIKEKMNLDVEVAKLKVLKADHQSQKYRLEDKLLKEFPASIQRQKVEIAALQQDVKVVELNPQVKDGFCGMTVKGMHFEDKLVAGERLLLACKEMPTAETVTLGQYRGFGLDLRFDTFRNEYQAVLRGATSHFVPLGTDARGNLTRLDNALDSFPDRIARAENQLQTLYQQRDAAQVEVEKPFPKEAELAEKSARLAELDTLLNMEGRPEPEREEPETEQGERRPSVLAGLKTAAAEKPIRDKAQKKEEPER